MEFVWDFLERKQKKIRKMVEIYVVYDKMDIYDNRRGG